jgi:hypothetical protein
MPQSDSIKELVTALSKVQGELTYAKKDSANPFFKSTYADLESVWGACRSLLAANGLSVIQMPGNFFEGRMWLITRLCHNSGEWIEQEMSVPVQKMDVQGCGSALSYMRRYSLSAFIGIVQSDDDGNAASNSKTNGLASNQSGSSPTAVKAVVKSIEI